MLKLSTLWEFPAIRKLALDRLGLMVASDHRTQIVLAYGYDVKEWLLSGLNALAQREHPLDERDVEALGLVCVLKLAEVREKYVPGQQSPNYDSGCLPTEGPISEQLFFRTERERRAARAARYGIVETPELEKARKRGRAGYDFTKHVKDVFRL